MRMYASRNAETMRANFVVGLPMSFSIFTDNMAGLNLTRAEDEKNSPGLTRQEIDKLKALSAFVDGDLSSNCPPGLDVTQILRVVYSKVSV